MATTPAVTPTVAQAITPTASFPWSSNSPLYPKVPVVPIAGSNASGSGITTGKPIFA